MTAKEWYKLGRAFYDRKNFRAAGVCFDRSIGLDGKVSKAWRWRGHIWNSSHDLQRAMQCYEEAVGLDPNDAYNYNGRGNVLQKTERYEEALAAFDQAIELDPKDAIPHNGRGNVLDDLERCEEALVAFDQAIELDPKDAYPHHGRGNVLQKTERYGEALAAFDQAIELDPKNAAPHNGRGSVLQKTERYEEALAAYDQAIKLDPKDAIPHNGQGNVLQKTERYEEALAAFDQAIELDPKDANPHNGRGIVLQKTERYEEALAAYDQAIKLDNSKWFYYYNCLSVLIKLGEKRKASQYTNRIMVLRQFVRPPGLLSDITAHPFLLLQISSSLDSTEYRTYSHVLDLSSQFSTYEAYRITPNSAVLTSAILHLHMRGYISAYQLLKDHLADTSSSSPIHHYFYQRAAYFNLEPLSTDYLSASIATARAYAIPRRGRLKRLFGQRQQLEEREVLNCYYAGHLLLDHGAYLEALRCFERIEDQFIPARYYVPHVLRLLGSDRKADKKITQLSKDKNAIQRYANGFQRKTIDIDADPLPLLLEYAHEVEVAEVIDHLKLPGRRSVFSRTRDLAFYESHSFRKEDLERIRAALAARQRKAWYRKLFRESLLWHSMEQLEKLDAEELRRKLLDEQSESKAIECYRILGNSEEAELLQQLGKYINERRLAPDSLRLLLNVFFAEGKLDAYDKWKLEFFLSLRVHEQKTKLKNINEDGLRDTLKQLTEEPISTGVSLATVSFISMTNPIAGMASGMLIKYATAALTDLVINYLQAERQQFANFKVWEDGFEAFIIAERERLGEVKFYRKYPLEVLEL